MKSKIYIIVITLFFFSSQPMYSQWGSSSGDRIIGDIGNSTSSNKKNRNKSYGVVTDSYCGLPCTSSITIHPDSLLDDVTYTWSGPDNFSGATQTVSNLESGFYYVTIKGNYVPILSFFPTTTSTEHLSFFVANYATWITDRLKVSSVNKLTSEEAISPNFNTAYSLNHTGVIEGTEWVNFHHEHNKDVNEEEFYVGLNGAGSLATLENLERGILIRITTSWMYEIGMSGASSDLKTLVTSSTYKIYENGQVVKEANSSDVDYDLYFEITKEGSETVVKLKRKQDEEIKLLYEFSSSTTEDYQLVAGISTKGTSIKQTVVTFCPPIKPFYNVLKKTLDGGFALVNSDTLRFMFDEQYFVAPDINITYKVYKYEGGSPQPVSFIGSGLIQYGDNRYELDVSDLELSTDLSSSYYILEVINNKKEKWYLKFKMPKE